MALAATTKIANRYGLDLVFHNIADGTDTTGDITIDFANEVSIEVTGDAVYATGGQGHKRLIGFNNPLEGSMTISTQIITPSLMQLITADAESDTGTAVFKSRSDMSYYKVTGTTVWKDENGVTYDETITAYKCIVRPNYSASYTGDGDPHSIDVNVELLEDDTEGMISFTHADQTPPEPDPEDGP